MPVILSSMFIIWHFVPLFNLIIAVIELSQLDPWLLLESVDSIGFASSDWNHLTCTIISVVDCWHFLCILFHTSCAHGCFISIPIWLNCLQLIRVTLRPTTKKTSNSNGGANFIKHRFLFSAFSNPFNKLISVKSLYKWAVAWHWNAHYHISYY